MAPNNFWDIISESRNIFKLKYSLVPFSFLLSLNLSHIFNHFFTHISNTNLQQQIPNPTSLLYSLLALVFSNCGVISTTYCGFHSFYGRPLNLQFAIQSIITSFLPLLDTTIVSQVIIFFISLFYGFLLVIAIHGAELVHLKFSYSSPYIIGLFIALPLLLVLIYLLVNWTLVPVIVVVETCWGLEPLRSTRLIKGIKGVALYFFFVCGFFGGIIFLWNGIPLTVGSNEITDSWVYWASIVSQYCFLAIVMLSYIAVNTILYIYCCILKGIPTGKVSRSLK